MANHCRHATPLCYGRFLYRGTLPHQLGQHRHQNYHPYGKQTHRMLRQWQGVYLHIQNNSPKQLLEASRQELPQPPRPAPGYGFLSPQKAVTWVAGAAPKAGARRKLLEDFRTRRETIVMFESPRRTGRTSIFLSQSNYSHTFVGLELY